MCDTPAANTPTAQHASNGPEGEAERGGSWRRERGLDRDPLPWGQRLGLAGEWSHQHRGWGAVEVKRHRTVRGGSNGWASEGKEESHDASPSKVLQGNGFISRRWRVWSLSPSLPFSHCRSASNQAAQTRSPSLRLSLSLTLSLSPVSRQSLLGKTAGPFPCLPRHTRTPLRYGDWITRTRPCIRSSKRRLK